MPEEVTLIFQYSNFPANFIQSHLDAVVIDNIKGIQNKFVIQNRILRMTRKFTKLPQRIKRAAK